MNEKQEKEKRRLKAIARSAMVCCYMGGTSDTIESLEKELTVYDPDWVNKTKSVIEQAKADQKRQEVAEEKKADEAKKLSEAEAVKIAGEKKVTEIVKGVEDEKKE